MIYFQTVSDGEVEFIQNQRLGDVPGEVRMSVNRGHGTRPPTLIGDRKFFGAAQCKSGNQLQRKGGCMIVVDDNSHIWIEILYPLLRFFKSFKQLYYDNVGEFCELQDKTVKKGTEQTPLNYWLQMNDVEVSNDVEVTNDVEINDIVEMNEVELNDVKEVSNDIVETKQDDSIINNIINQVEGSLETYKPDMMGGLFISVASSSIDVSTNIDDSNKLDSNERIVELEATDVEEIIEDVEDVKDVEDVEDVKDVEDVNDPILEHMDETNYEEYTIKDLKTTLEDMKLSTSGNKSKLIERIISNKK